MHRDEYRESTTNKLALHHHSVKLILANFSAPRFRLEKSLAEFFMRSRQDQSTPSKVPFSLPTAILFRYFMGILLRRMIV
jgi:hypothetical protein